MKIVANLNGFETEALFDILNHEIIKYKIESKFDLLEGKISKWQFDWNQSHAEFLEGIKNKLINHHENNK